MPKRRPVGSRFGSLGTFGGFENNFIDLAFMQAKRRYVVEDERIIFNLIDMDRRRARTYARILTSTGQSIILPIYITYVRQYQGKVRPNTLS